MRLLFPVLLLVTLAMTGQAAADPGEGSRPTPQPPQTAKPWCPAELEALPGDVCYAPVAPKPDGPRSLVIFLHGLVQQGAGWQHNQMSGMARGGQRLGFSVLAPRGQPGGSRKHGADMVAWPTGRAAQQAHEDALIDQWTQARQLVEQRQGAPFDEVFVVGFSNGAYYGASLALRGRLAIDGYALFAGGAPRQPTASADRRRPIFVGVSGKDDTAKRALELGRALKRLGWPHRQETRRVGHLIADRHLDHALAYLRQARARTTPGKSGDGSP
ncbi:MAG: hypothetical protein JRI68_31105 [Deltaproteobacteria bacterium]|nr:hypothetical protein [Deltaproteobacteria bacterium]